jgi:TorA maturation chaperone TorD
LASADKSSRDTDSDDGVPKAIAEDLRLLAFLHDREPELETVRKLRGHSFQDWLGLTLGSKGARECIEVFDRALEALPRDPDRTVLDNLAADYADIYFTYRYRASPTESVWLDDDGLERQSTMFQVRDWYRRYGLVVHDRLGRPDDHLVLQLSFLAELFGRADGGGTLKDAARFMDAHLLRWVGQFCGRVASRCAAPFFAGLALATAAYLEEIRIFLTEATGEPRRDPAACSPPDAGNEPGASEEPAYVPGTAPGW